VNEAPAGARRDFGAIRDTDKVSLTKIAKFGVEVLSWGDYEWLHLVAGEPDDDGVPSGDFSGSRPHKKSVVLWEIQI